MVAWSADVIAAQARDAAAFGRLVRRFGPGARACALAWLGDPARAEEVCQEALLHAWLHLDALAVPAAFPAWLRRIVRKFADRVTRRRALPWAAPEVAATLPAPEPTAEETLSQGAEDALVRAALARLPEPERLAVALHSLAGWPVAEVALALGVTPAALKKRLQRARGRLHQEVNAMLAQRPRLEDPDLERAVRYFIAVRTGDAVTVQAALAEDPRLVDKAQPDSARYRPAGGPGDGTGLHLAVRLGAGEVVEGLLRAGAAMDRPDRTGLHPLHLAALLGDLACTRALLTQGADPDARTPKGLTPLHLACMEGADAVADTLRAAGASAEARDAGGRRPADWAALRAPLAALPAADGIVWTGIRVIDHFAPAPRGGRIRLTGGHGIGMMVLLAELLWRHQQRTGRPGHYLPWAERLYGDEDLQGHRRDLGLGPAPQGAPGPEDLVVVDHVRWRQAGCPDFGGATVIVFEGWEASLDPPDLAPWPITDARWILDPARAARGVWPAVDPLQSESGAPLSATQAAARAALRARLAGDAQALDGWLHQPFFTARYGTACPGEDTVPWSALP